MKARFVVAVLLLLAVAVSARRTSRRAKPAQVADRGKRLMNSDPLCYDDYGTYPTAVPAPGGPAILPGRFGAVSGDTCSTTQTQCDDEGNSADMPLGSWGLPSDPQHQGSEDLFGPPLVAYEFTTTGPETLWISSCPACPGQSGSSVIAQLATEIWIESVGASVAPIVNPWNSDPAYNSGQSNPLNGATWCADNDFCAISHDKDDVPVEPAADQCGYGIGVQSFDLPGAGTYRLFLAYRQMAWKCMWDASGNLGDDCNLPPPFLKANGGTCDANSADYTSSFGDSLYCDYVQNPNCGAFTLSYSFNSADDLRQQLGCPAPVVPPPEASSTYMQEKCDGLTEELRQFCLIRHGEL